VVVGGACLLARVAYARSNVIGNTMSDEAVVQRVAMTRNGAGYLKRTWQNLVIRIALAALLLSLLPIGRV